jgi:phosphopantetheine adenylyltransferase
MKKIVIVPGGFHPWHGGHTALYNAARAAFPSAEVFVASTDDTAERPFPFRVKKILAQAAGVPGNRFIQVKSPFRAQEITQMYDPDTTQLIFVRSEKDQEEMPRPGGVKKNGELAYLQPYKRNGLEPMNQHGYMAYLPVAQFGGGMTSATEIRAKWPELRDDQKIKLIKELYPSTVNNDSAAKKLIEILDSVLIQQVGEDLSQHVIPMDQQNLIANLSKELSQFVSLIKNGNYIEAQQLLKGEIAARMYDLTQLDRPMDNKTEYDQLSPINNKYGATDYVEEKSINL